MRNLKTLLTVAFAVAAAILAVPSLASAETFCVNAGAACPVGGHDVGNLQGAMDQAGELDGDDEVLLGDKQTPYFGPFAYAPALLSRQNHLTIRGVGGRPSVTGPIGETILTLPGGSLENVTILGDFGEGSTLSLRGGDLRDVKVVGPDELSPDMHGPGVTGPATLENVEITGGFEEALSVSGGEAGQQVLARRLNIHGGPLIGIGQGQFGQLTLSDSRVSARNLGIRSAGTVEVTRSVIETSDPESVGLGQRFASLGPYVLDHVTVAHTGSPSGSDSAFELRAATELDTRLHAVAMVGYTRGFTRIDENGSPENVVISDSAWDPANDELTGHGVGVLVENRNVHAEPEVVNLAGGDLHLRPGSAAIDRDAISDLAQFTDLDGVPAIDGDGDGIVRPDAGAFEFQPPAAPPAGGTGGSGAGGGGNGGGGIPSADATVPVLKNLRLTSGRVKVARAARVSLAGARKLRLAFTASEASTVRIVPRRVVGGRLAKPRRAIVRTVAAGRGSIALGKSLRRAGVLRPGEVRLVVTARDAAGNRSAKRVLALRLKA